MRATHNGLQVTALLTRTLDELRLFLPAAAGLHNPVDMLATATADQFARAMRVLLADPNVDSLLTIFIPPLVTAAADVAAAMTRGRTRSGQACSRHLHERGRCDSDAGAHSVLPVSRSCGCGAGTRHFLRELAATTCRHYSGLR